MPMKTAWLCAAALSLFTTAAVAADDLASPKYGTWGFDLSARDPAAKPGNDFFRYADGTGLDKLVIPSDRARFGNFDVLAELSQKRVRAVIEGVPTNASPATEAGKIGAFYRGFLDEKQVESLGVAPLKPELDAVRKVKTHRDMAALMGRSPTSFASAIFSLHISPDDKDPNSYAVWLSQAGLGLPDRDYYSQASFAEKKAAYEAYVAKMLTLAGWPEPAANARAIVAFETRIAAVSWTRAERRDADKVYNPMTPAELAAAAPGFDWAAFMAAADLGKVKRVIVGESTAFPKIAAVFAETPIATLQAWEAFNIADSAAPYLPARFVNARFEFRSKTLSGQPELQARWKRGVNTVEGSMGEAVGREYVARYFPPTAKAKMEALVADLRAAFKGRIERIDWMTPSTRAAALDKLAKYNVKIGYPAKWRDYSKLVIRQGDLAGNVIRSGAFEWAYQVGRLNKPVDRADWGMTPQTVNAYNDPVMSEVVFPAAILQPPFFDPDADPAINYGAIGGVIGHEMTHGFDDQGRKYDASGKLQTWWGEADIKAFQDRAAKLGAQYSAFEPLPGAKVNGELTMGENIADLGGLLLALDAYHLSLGGKPAPVIDGLTGDQRVFFGWAQVWREKRREDSLRQQVVVDPHSPAQFRVNGVVRNIDAWYAAFDVKPGDKLYVAPADRVRIW
ncbi:MAG: M13-type metalloendopeptidase [Caulobacteraceae bacterium]